MGISVSDVKAMTMWEFGAVADRYLEAHEQAHDKPGSRLTDDDKDELFDWVKSRGSPVSHAAAKAKVNGHGH